MNFLGSPPKPANAVKTHLMPTPARHATVATLGAALGQPSFETTTEGAGRTAPDARLIGQTEVLVGAAVGSAWTAAAATAGELYKNAV